MADVVLRYWPFREPNEHSLHPTMCTVRLMTLTVDAGFPRRNFRIGTGD